MSCWCARRPPLHHHVKHWSRHGRHALRCRRAFGAALNYVKLCETLSLSSLMYIGHGEDKERMRRSPTTKEKKWRSRSLIGLSKRGRDRRNRGRQTFVRSGAQANRCASQKKAFISVRPATQWRFTLIHGQSAAISRVCLLCVCTPERLTRLSAERGFQRHGRRIGWPSAATDRALRSLFADAFGRCRRVAYRR